MRLYIIMALILALTVSLLYWRYRRNPDIGQLLRDTGIVAVAIFFTYIGKMILVHKPIFIVHLAFVMLSWFAVYLYLLKERLNLWFLLAPAATTLFFIIEALFFREHG